MTKKSLLKDIVVQRYSKPIMFIKLKDNDEVVDVLMDPYNEVFIATKKGYGLWYDRSEIPLIGLKTAGVKAINLKDDNVASACVFDGAFEYVTVITHKGLAKRIKLSEFEKTTRAKRGLLLLREVKSNPQEILKTYVSDAKKMIVLVSDNDTKEIKLTEIPIMDRNSTGSTITKKKLDNVYEVSHLTKDDVTNKKESRKNPGAHKIILVPTVISAGTFCVYNTIKRSDSLGFVYHSNCSKVKVSDRLIFIIRPPIAAPQCSIANWDRRATSPKRRLWRMKRGDVGEKQGA